MLNQPSTSQDVAPEEGAGIDPETGEVLVPPQAFTHFLLGLEDNFHDQASHTLQKMIHDLQDRMKADNLSKVKGKMTLSFEIQLEDDMAMIVPGISVKVPSPRQRRTMRYHGHGGKLLDNHPQQPELPLKAVAQQDVRTV